MVPNSGTSKTCLRRAFRGPKGTIDLRVKFSGSANRHIFIGRMLANCHIIRMYSSKCTSWYKHPKHCILVTARNEMKTFSESHQNSSFLILTYMAP